MNPSLNQLHEGFSRQSTLEPAAIVALRSALVKGVDITDLILEGVHHITPLGKHVGLFCDLLHSANTTHRDVGAKILSKTTFLYHLDEEQLTAEQVETLYLRSYDAIDGAIPGYHFTSEVDIPFNLLHKEMCMEDPPPALADRLSAFGELIERRIFDFNTPNSAISGLHILMLANREITEAIAAHCLPIIDQVPSNSPLYSHASTAVAILGELANTELICQRLSTLELVRLEKSDNSRSALCSEFRQRDDATAYAISRFLTHAPEVIREIESEILLSYLAVISRHDASPIELRKIFQSIRKHPDAPALLMHFSEAHAHAFDQSIIPIATKEFGGKEYHVQQIPTFNRIDMDRIQELVQRCFPDDSPTIPLYFGDLHDLGYLPYARMIFAVREVITGDLVAVNALSGAQLSDSFEYSMHWLATDPNHRGLGIATYLRELVCGAAAHLRINTLIEDIDLSTRSFNPKTDVLASYLAAEPYYHTAKSSSGTTHTALRLELNPRRTRLPSTTSDYAYVSNRHAELRNE